MMAANVPFHLRIKEKRMTLVRMLVKRTQTTTGVTRKTMAHNGDTVIHRLATKSMIATQISKTHSDCFVLMVQWELTEIGKLVAAILIEKLAQPRKLALQLLAAMEVVKLCLKIAGIKVV
jgi:hypothetical protein